MQNLTDDFIRQRFYNLKIIGKNKTYGYLYRLFIEVNPVYFDFFVEVNHGQVLYYGSYLGFSGNLLKLFRDKWKTVEVIHCQTKKYWR